ncbi:MAG: UvrD-helicase domain-containing protein [Lachnospiraceae bacterium]|nr:UvrD-helicase domain-containing protein [Lachnospiraceae bacterium]
MELLNLEEFMKQTENKRLSKRLAEKIENELVRLYEVAGQGTYSLQAYLRSKNGKKLQGTKKKERHIFKYRLTAGDRLFYTYGKYVEGIPEEKKDSLVLLKYTIHDRQGREKKLAQGQEFAPVEETPGAGEAFTEEDLKLFGIQDTENTEEVEACIDRIFLAYSEKHKKFVAPVQELLKAEKEGKNTGIKLSPDQEEILGKFLKNPCPTLILGGAGTGKTLLSLHLLNDYFSELDDTRCAYFTQSEALLNKAKNEYESISGKKPENNLYFYDINEFCIGLLEKLGQPVDRKKFVKTPMFQRFYREHQEVQKLCKKLRLSEMDLWTEIRGVIKGSMTSDWKRTKMLGQDNFDGKVIKELEEKGFIQRGKEKKQFQLSKQKEKCPAEILSESARVRYKEMVQYYQGVDNEAVELEEERYFLLSEEQTMVERDKRPEVYRMYQKYKDWLDFFGYFDENDLIRKTRSVMEQCHVLGTEQFQFMVVDEVQDYTELQIYFLHELAEDKNYLIYAGDRNQIINPTLFDERKLAILYQNRLQTEYLQQNFRCQKEVVALGNALSEMRRRKIASKKKEAQESSEKPGPAVMKLEYSEENLRKILLELLKYPGVAVLVPDEGTKQSLIDFIGRESYEKADNRIVYYISEIKGMEYRYVLCVNMVSRYSMVWKQIIESNEARRNTRYRYFFNLLYVAITRAKDYLCLLEQETETETIFQEIGRYAAAPLKLEDIAVFDENRMYITALSNQSMDWLASAEANFLNGLYDVALNHYERAGAGKEKIALCRAELAAQENNFTEALRQFLLADSEEGLKRYQKEAAPETDLSKLVQFFISPVETTGQEWFLTWDMEQGIELLFAGEEKESMEAAVLGKLEKMAEERSKQWTLEEVLKLWEK